jgi:hypothetical protein
LFAALVAAAAIAIPTTIEPSVAPISIDRCETLLQPVASGEQQIADYIDFTNVSQKIATEVRFSLRILDADGMPQRTLNDDRSGRFSPGVPEDDPIATHARVDALPSSAHISCAVQMVHFDDGSVWNEGDGPMGSGSLFTPPPQPPATPSWRFPGDDPTP